MDITRIRMADGAVVGNYLYFSNVSSNGLYRVDMSTHDVELIDFFPNERINIGFLHKNCFVYGNRLFFIPAYAKDISVYDISKKKFTMIPFENTSNVEATIDSIQVGSSVYIFPVGKKCVPLVLNMEKLEIEKIKDFCVWIDKYVSKEEIWKFYRVSESKGMFYFALTGTDLIASWNCETGEFVTYPTNMDKIINVLVQNGKCYFTLRNKYGVGKLNFSDGNVEFVSTNDTGTHNIGTLYSSLGINEGKLLAVPAYGEYLHYFNDEDLSLTKEIAIAGNDYKFLRFIILEDETWLLPFNTDTVYVHKKTDEIDIFMLKPTNEVYRKIKAQRVNEFINANCVIGENSEVGLTHLIKYLVNNGGDVHENYS